MPKIAYKEIRFKGSARAVVAQAQVILNEYSGLALTLRQLYYQFVARGLLPNRQTEYNRLGRIVDDARMSGHIDWDSIIDRTRGVRSLSHWDDPSEIIDACAKQYRVDMWAHQGHRPEVWVEKDALVGIVQQACEPLDVPYLSCRGYTSQSEMWRSSQRLKSYLEGHQTPVIFHFGDHDPSGKDMTRDIVDRLQMFLRAEGLLADNEEIEVRRLALNMDQVRKYKPPPNPAKQTDSRFEAYAAEFGNESWELDALDPKLLHKTMQTAINDLIDEDLWQQDASKAKKGRELLAKAAKRWPKLAKSLARSKS